MIKTMVCILILIALLSPCLYSGDYSVDKGGFMLSGNINLTSALGDANSRSISERLHLSPSLAYFITHNLGIGAELVFERLDYYGSEIRALAIGPQITYYIGGRDRGGYPFASASFQYLEYDFGMEYTNASGSGYQYNLGLGYMDMLTRHAALSAEFRYLIQHSDIDRYGFGDWGHALYMSIGLSYFIF